MCDEEVRSIEEDIGASPESMPYLILADGILMDSNRVKEYRQKKSQGTQLDRNENARDIRCCKIPIVIDIFDGFCSIHASTSTSHFMMEHGLLINVVSTRELQSFKGVYND
ncbi:unnamed protein product [Penicillium manginii]